MQARVCVCVCVRVCVYIYIYVHPHVSIPSFRSSFVYGLMNLGHQGL